MWPFRIKKPWLELYSRHSRWADNLTDKYSKRDFAIQLGMLSAGIGAGYRLQVKEITGNSLVYEPHVFEIIASTITSINYKAGKISEERWLDLYFTAYAKSYSIRSIALAVKDACVRRKEKTRLEKIV